MRNFVRSVNLAFLLLLSLPAAARPAQKEPACGGNSNFHSSDKSQILPVSGEATRADHGDRALWFGHKLPL